MTDALRDRLYRRLHEGVAGVKVEEIAAIRAAVDGHRYSGTPREYEAFKTLLQHTDAQAQRIALLEEALRKSLAIVKETSWGSEVGYGYFCGGDPRNFKPDLECSTEDERTRWKADCEAWEKGEQKDCPPTGKWLSENVHVLSGGYGLGGYVYQDPTSAKVLAELHAALLLNPVTHDAAHDAK